VWESNEKLRKNNEGILVAERQRRQRGGGGTPANKTGVCHTVKSADTQGRGNFVGGEMGQKKKTEESRGEKKSFGGWSLY